MTKRILAFDVSSTTLAYAVLEINEDKSIQFILANYIKPNKKGNIIERLADTRNQIKKVIEDIKPDYIAIEDIVQFMAGASSAKTLIMLTSFNRLVGLLAYDFLNRSPELFSVMTIRHCIKRQAGLNVLPTKEDLPLILEKLLNIKFPWEYSKKGKIKEENYDKSDAISCAYCYIINMNKEIADDNIKTRKNTGSKSGKINK